MWNLGRSLVLWLHESEHVARFQRYFGVLPLFNSKSEDKCSDKNKTDIKDEQLNTSNGMRRPHHARKVTYDTNILDECLEELKHSTGQNETKKTTSSDIDYKITSWFWYYFFQFGSSMGNEIFYIIFFPTWVWNVDGCAARKVGIVWAFIMYIGQATKDILCMSRPTTPPAVKLEKRYIEEYGFPSTHAMFATAIPLSLVLLTRERYDFNIWFGIVGAAIVCTWVCLSRIYLGMHTFLDIVGGTTYALVLISVIFPYVSSIDNFQLTNTCAPLINFCLGIFLIKCYPSKQLWSTARSDTTVILGSTFGLLSATTIMNKLGLLEKPLMPPIYQIIPPDLGFCVLRTIIGLFIVYCTRQIIKTVVLRVTCSLYGLNWKDPEVKRFAQVEMPYYYLTYWAIGFNISFTCPLIYRAIGINRDYSFTEV